jgi:hypothetical protein
MKRQQEQRTLDDMGEAQKDSVRWLPQDLRELVELRHQPDSDELEGSEYGQ